jgi:hypothetical protein
MHSTCVGRTIVLPTFERKGAIMVSLWGWCESIEASGESQGEAVEVWVWQEWLTWKARWREALMSWQLMKLVKKRSCAGVERG